MKIARTLALALIAGCLSPSGPTVTGTGKRILFIGNSHTYVNDVPGLVQALATAVGPEPIAVASDAPPNYALIDHWNSAATRHAVTGGHWHMVVMQQGWTPAGACRDTLRLATKLFAGIATASGAKVGVYQVWAPIDRPAHVAGSIRSYELAADDVGGMLFPVAAAFRAAKARNPGISLYADGLHASSAGSYLTAIVIYATLFDRTPIGLPTAITSAGGTMISLTVETAAMLQEAAADVTIRGGGRSGGEDGPLIANPGRC